MSQNKLVVELWNKGSNTYTVWDCIEGVRKQLTQEQLDQEESWGATIELSNLFTEQQAAKCKATKHYKSLLDILFDVCDNKVTVTVLDTNGNKCMSMCKDAVKHMVKVARAGVNCTSEDTSVYKIHWLVGGESLIKVEVV